MYQYSNSLKQVISFGKTFYLTFGEKIKDFGKIDELKCEICKWMLYTMKTVS